MPSQEILKIRDDRPSQEILKIRDGTPLEAEEILTYIKSLQNGLVCYFSSKLDVPSNVLQKKRVARILFFKIKAISRNFKNSTRNRSMPSQVILKNRDGTPLETEEILTYIKSLQNGLVCYFSSKLHVPSNVLQKKRVARILFFKIRPSQEILKIRDGTPFEAEEMLTYIKEHSKQIEILKIRDGTPLELDVPSNLVHKKRVAQLHFFKISPSKEILKICDGTPLEAEEILTYIKSLRNGSVCYFSSKLNVPSNIVQKKRVARIMFFKIRSSQEIIKIRDGTPLEAEGILTYIKSPRNGSICYFSSKLDVPSNVVQKKRVARIMFFKIRPSQEILKIRDATPLEVEGILAYIKSPRNGSICYFSSKLDAISRNLKIRDGTPLEAEGILTYIKSPRNGSICYFSSKLDVPSNVVQKKRVAQLHFFKIRPSQEILKIRDATPLEAEEILTYIKKGLQNGPV
ncbi:hypothetical protein OROMI_024961 [Orobanche minor]